jgi:hypothetical protein
MRKYRILEAFVISLLFSMWTLSVFAQVDTAWVRRYDGPGSGLDYAKSIAVDLQSNIYVTGISNKYSHPEYNYDYATIKYYPNGDIAWVRRYNGPKDDYDEAYAIAVDVSGNVYVTGESEGKGTDNDYATIKYYPNGDTVWVRRYNGPGNAYDRAVALVIDSAGNVYVTGRSEGSGTGKDYATIKYFPDGDTAWVRRYNGPTNEYDEAYAIAVDEIGNVYVTGVSDSNYVTIKYFSNGDTAWVRRYEGLSNWDVALAVAIDSTGDVYVTGHSGTIKYDADGNQLWPALWAGVDIVSDYSGNIYLTGRSWDSLTNVDYATTKCYPDGDTAWRRTYKGVGKSFDKAVSITLDRLSNVYVTGVINWGTAPGPGTCEDFCTVKYDTDGNELWAAIYNHGTGDWDEAYDIAVDDSGNVYVTGRSGGDYATIKYVQGEVFVEEEDQVGIVSSFVLHQNYPNPFNPQTIIEYTLNSPSEVSLGVYNIKGQLVKTLIDGHREKGFHRVLWDGKNDKGEKTSSGIYYYQFKAEDYVETKKMVKLR